MNDLAIPALFALQALFALWSARTAGTSRAGVAVVVLCLVLGAWGILGAGLARSGVYDDPGFLALMPGLWLPIVPLALCAACLAVPAVRAGVMDLAERVPPQRYIVVQILRVAALGTLIGTAQGRFPVEVELAIGITDLAFGLSAIAVAALWRARRLSRDAVALWHLVGVAIIVLPGGLAMQSGLPGPHRVFDEPPTSEVMLDWPMVLAPSLVVPTFLALNVLGAFSVLRSRT